MSDQAGYFEKCLSSNCSFEPHRFFCGPIVLIEDRWSDCLIAFIYRHKSFTVRIQTQSSDGVGKILGYRLRTIAHRLPKAFGIYLRAPRSGKLRRVRVSVLGKYLTCQREHHRFAPARTDIDGQQTHDGFRFPLALPRGVHPNCRDSSQLAQGKACVADYSAIGAIHRNLSAATESFRP
jgi:hypothetical protein